MIEWQSVGRMPLHTTHAITQIHTETWGHSRDQLNCMNSHRTWLTAHVGHCTAWEKGVSRYCLRHLQASLGFLCAHPCTMVSPRPGVNRCCLAQSSGFLCAPLSAWLHTDRDRACRHHVAVSEQGYTTLSMYVYIYTRHWKYGMSDYRYPKEHQNHYCSHLCTYM